MYSIFKRCIEYAQQPWRGTSTPKTDLKYILKIITDIADYHKWSLTICDGCFDTLKSSKMRSKASDKRCC